MRHLFIINPDAHQLKGRTDDVIREIRSFFANYPQIRFDIHVTRWKRDAVGFTRRCVSGAGEIVRVYAVGGMGTLFEVINGVIGLPNVQVTAWPFGIDNSFLYYFGEKTIDWFRSLRNLVFSGVRALDVIRCGSNYSICSCYMGLEAVSAQYGDRIINRSGFFSQWAGGVYFTIAMYHALKKENEQPYHVSIDGLPLNGNYISLLIANQPYYAKGMYPAVDARPNDGILDLYLLRAAPGLKIIAMASDYVKGSYHKWPHNILHFRGKTITISSDQIMSICLDGEMFFDAVVEYEVIPHAVDFVCPPGTGIGTGPGLPRQSRSPSESRSSQENPDG
jgi:diacylglycerol kinase family enzyme